MGQFSIRANHLKNRLYLELLGAFDDEQLEELSVRLLAVILELRPGFDVINDVTHCLPMTPDGVLVMKETQKRVKSAGVGRVVRVVGEAIVANLQLSLHADEVGYRAHTATSVGQAEHLLDAVPCVERRDQEIPQRSAEQR